MKVIGLCRFSYLGHGGFKLEHATLDERRNYLYAPDRLEERFRLFETVCLPSIAGQSDQDFQLLVVIGECFPHAYLERLLDLTEPLRNVVVHALPPGRHRQVMARALNKARGGYDRPCLQFRLDDDDGVNVEFIARLRAAADSLAPVWQHYPMTTFDFNRGYIYRASADGMALVPNRYQYTAVALGVAVPAGSKQTIMKHGHQNLWRETPTLTFPDGDMYLRGHNAFNDTQAKGRGTAIQPLPVTEAQAAFLRDSFNVDNEVVKQVFSRPGP